MTKFTKYVLICWILALISLGLVAHLAQKEINQQIEATTGDR